MIASRLQKHKAAKALKLPDYWRLLAYARGLLTKCRYSLSITDPEAWELVNTAILIALDSDHREWPMYRVDFIGFVMGIMRNEVTNDVAAQANHRPPRVIGEQAEIAIEQFRSSHPLPDEQLEKQQEARQRDRLYRYFEALLDNDSESNELYRLKCQELTGPEIQAKLKISVTEYGRRDRKLRRLIDALGKRWREGAFNG